VLLGVNEIVVLFSNVFLRELNLDAILVLSWCYTGCCGG
jgi:hypothetical protein